MYILVFIQVRGDPKPCIIVTGLNFVGAAPCKSEKEKTGSFLLSRGCSREGSTILQFLGDLIVFFVI